MAGGTPMTQETTKSSPGVIEGMIVTIVTLDIFMYVDGLCWVACKVLHHMQLWTAWFRRTTQESDLNRPLGVLRNLCWPAPWSSLRNFRARVRRHAGGRWSARALSLRTTLKLSNGPSSRVRSWLRKGSVKVKTFRRMWGGQKCQNLQIFQGSESLHRQWTGEAEKPGTPATPWTALKWMFVCPKYGMPVFALLQ